MVMERAPRGAELLYSEGRRPSDSPTRSLARRFAGALRSRGSHRFARSRYGRIVSLARVTTASLRSLALRAHRVARFNGEQAYHHGRDALPARRFQGGVQMDREALGHFQRQRIDLLPVFRGQSGCFAPQSLKLAPADLLELLM